MNRHITKAGQMHNIYACTVYSKNRAKHRCKGVKAEISIPFTCVILNIDTKKLVLSIWSTKRLLPVTVNVYVLV